MNSIDLLRGLSGIQDIIKSDIPNINKGGCGIFALNGAERSQSARGHRCKDVSGQHCSRKVERVVRGTSSCTRDHRHLKAAPQPVAVCP